MEKKVDIVIPVIKDDLRIINLSLDYISIFLPTKNIIFVGHSSLEKDLPKTGNVYFVNEDELLEGMSLNKIKSILNDLTGNSNRAGWYFQQFLKMSYAYKCQDDAYIVFDADTIPLNKIEYIEDNKYLFNIKKENHTPYFDTIDKLFNFEIYKSIDGSFISENMVIDKKIMIEMLNEIEVKCSSEGNNFYEKILNSISSEEINYSGFSEFETYGNYVNIRHQKLFKRKKLNSLREGIKYLGKYPSKKQLNWASKDFDLISIEKKDKVSTFYIFSTLFFRKIVRLKTVHLFRKIIRKYYRSLFHKNKTFIDYD
jgi:hypothetical protein